MPSSTASGSVGSPIVISIDGWDAGDAELPTDGGGGAQVIVVTVFEGPIADVAAFGDGVSGPEAEMASSSVVDVFYLNDRNK